ncbi:MAG: hypothetical protein NC313_04695 [Butyrivibrio sp.]|nr:hypothetical protein [Butyrivibrio sp.]
MLGEILDLPMQLLDALKKTVSDLESNKTSIAEGAAVQKDIEHINVAIAIIETDTANSRKVKNYLKGIKSDIMKLNAAWEEDSANLCLNGDWIAPIIRVQF